MSCGLIRGLMSQLPKPGHRTMCFRRNPMRCRLLCHAVVGCMSTGFCSSAVELVSCLPKSRQSTKQDAHFNSNVFVFIAHRFPILELGENLLRLAYSRPPLLHNSRNSSRGDRQLSRVGSRFHLPTGHMLSKGMFSIYGSSLLAL